MADNDIVICTEDPDVCQNGGYCIVLSDPRDNYCECPDITNGDRCHQVLGDISGSGNGIPQESAQAAAEAAFAEAAADEPVCTENGDQCQNGGFCVMATPDGEIKENYCVCPATNSGNRCHGTNPVDTSTSTDNSSSIPKKEVCTAGGNECLNGSSCILQDLDNEIPANYCDCVDGFFGDVCRGKHTGTVPPAPSNPATNDNDKCTEGGGECLNGASCIMKDPDNNVPANTCKCVNGFFGDICKGKHSTPPSATSSGSDTCTNGGMECENGGVCVLTSDQTDMSSGNYCSCPGGTSGDKCETRDICDLDCQHGSSCRHYDDISHDNGSGSVSFYCECAGNYKGMECEIPFTTCPISGIGKQLECLYGGDCVIFDEFSEEYKCYCPNGRSGDNCENGLASTIEDYNGACYQDEDCFNGGLCISNHDAKGTEETGMQTKTTQCLCSLGWGGDNCEYRCNTLNCQHGSSCRFPSADDITHANDSKEDGAFCECQDNYKGRECEIGVQKCPGSNSMECLYGGQCIGSQEYGDGDFYTCACLGGRMGDHCEKIDYDYKPFNDDKVYTSTTPSSSSNNSFLDQAEVLGPNIIIVSFSVLAFLMVIPVTLIFCRSHRQRKNAANVQQSVLECLDDGFDGTASATTETTDSKDNGNGATNGNGKGKPASEDIFDYDTDGVVNVNLDENEPVLLSKDKQIV